jgi:mitochondrial fission protein ELM1
MERGFWVNRHHAELQRAVRASPAPTRRVWLVLGDKLGDNGQVEIIADALGWPAERKNLRVLPQYVLGKPPFKPSLYHIDAAASDPLAPPWPDLVLTVGRRPSMAALWIKEQSGGRTKVLIVGRPRTRLRDFDLIVATPQYRLPGHGNVVRIDLPLMRVDPARVAAAVDAWRARLSGLPRPLTAVLVGGPTKPFVFDAEVTANFISALRRTTRDRGSLFITTSRRTPAEVVAALEANLPQNAQLYVWGAKAAENPYMGLLGLADQFVVTGDSLSMMIEVARIGRPLAIFQLPIERSAGLSARMLLARTFQPAPGSDRSTFLMRIGDAFHDMGIVGYAKDTEEVHRRLVAGGFAVMLGQSFAAPRGPVPDDAPRIAERIRALFDAR